MSDTEQASDRPLRICMVIESVGGGSCRHLVDLASGLIERGHDIHIIYSPVRASRRSLEELQGLDATLQALDMHRAVGWHDVRAMKALSSAIHDHGPFDIVHGHSSKAGALIRLARVGKAKRVYTPHGFRGLDPSAKISTRIIFDSVEMILGAVRTDALVMVSSGELNFARRRIIAKGRRHVIHNGVPKPSAVSRDEARLRLGVPSKAVVIGYVGRIDYAKAPERFVSAMAEVLRQDPCSYAVMMDDGNDDDAVAMQIASLGLGGRFIRLLNKDAAHYLPGFDILMMTSRYEGLPYVMLESLAAGVPIITTEIGGAGDVFGASGCGIVTRNGERAVEDLAAAALNLARDEDQRTKMAAAALRRGSELNGPRMIDQTEKLYRKLLNGRR